MIGRHYTKADWDNRAFALKQAYDNFCALAQQMAADVAPYTAAALVTRVNDPGFQNQEAVDLISGINVADTLRQLSLVNGTPAQAQANTASQASVALGKFGGA